MESSDLEAELGGSLVRDADILIDEDFPLDWKMTHLERVTLLAMLRKIRPECALEIGTCYGGSLQVIAKYTDKVFAIDRLPAVETTLAPQFPNTVFHIGRSKEMIPRALEQIRAEGRKLGFVLVDGDHTHDAVRDDINALLTYRPLTDVHMLLHDTFHPECREGILAAGWQTCRYVHRLELDFVPGVLMMEQSGMSLPRSMWCGFGYAVLRPTERQGPLHIRRSSDAVYRAVRRVSVNHPLRFDLRLMGRLRKRFRGA